jgi:hypothetical protein
MHEVHERELAKWKPAKPNRGRNFRVAVKDRAQQQ